MELVASVFSPQSPPAPSSYDALSDCLDASAICQITCSSCAEACFAEQELAALRRCIRLTLDSADLCGATVRFLSRFDELDLEIFRAQLEGCARACATCAAECLKHADKYDHCRLCAKAGKRCEETCLALANQIGQQAAA